MQFDTRTQRAIDLIVEDDKRRISEMEAVLKAVEASLGFKYLSRELQDQVRNRKQ